MIPMSSSHSPICLDAAFHYYSHLATLEFLAVKRERPATGYLDMKSHPPALSQRPDNWFKTVIAILYSRASPLHWLMSRSASGHASGGLSMCLEFWYLTSPSMAVMAQSPPIVRHFYLLCVDYNCWLLEYLRGFLSQWTRMDNPWSTWNTDSRQSRDFWALRSIDHSWVSEKSCWGHPSSLTNDWWHPVSGPVIISTDTYPHT